MILLRILERETAQFVIESAIRFLMIFEAVAEAVFIDLVEINIVI